MTSTPTALLSPVMLPAERIREAPALVSSRCIFSPSPPSPFAPDTEPEPTAMATVPFLVVQLFALQ